MKKFLTSLFLLFLVSQLGLAQNEDEIKSLLNGIPDSIYANSMKIALQSKRIISFGEKALPVLAVSFTDSTISNNKSRCQQKYLTKGEIAILLADLIEPIPYSTVTGAPSCELFFCQENSVLIEYYLPAIKAYGLENFKKKYLLWLVSNEREEWKIDAQQTVKKERKKEIRMCKREIRKNRK